MLILGVILIAVLGLLPAFGELFSGVAGSFGGLFGP